MNGFLCRFSERKSKKITVYMNDKFFRRKILKVNVNIYVERIPSITPKRKGRTFRLFILTSWNLVDCWCISTKLNDRFSFIFWSVSNGEFATQTNNDEFVERMKCFRKKTSGETKSFRFGKTEWKNPCGFRHSIQNTFWNLFSNQNLFLRHYQFA